MKHRTVWEKTVIVICICTLAVCVSTQAVASDTTGVNRYNVVIALDASGSLVNGRAGTNLGTDPNGLRFEAVSLFLNLLAERGNVLGGVIFSDEVRSFDMVEISSQTDKDRLSNSFRSVDARGYTNIGGALDKAVTMLEENGKHDLPSVILLFSDGYTEMPGDQQAESIALRDKAVEEARQTGIQIYSICLNANNTAHPEEMENISSATEGEFKEVEKAEDLQDVFEMFYNMIYGTTTKNLVEDDFPVSGMLETVFNVPGFGVEEVNIIAYGNPKDMTLYDPEGAENSVKPLQYETFSSIKLTEITPGEWKLVTRGDPGDPIKINMIYNTNLEVKPKSKVGELHSGDSAVVRVVLSDGEKTASTDKEYIGYTATLTLHKDGTEQTEQKEMRVKNGAFECAVTVGEVGKYTYDVRVMGEFLNKEFTSVDILTVEAQDTNPDTNTDPDTEQDTEPDPTPPPPNHPPEAKEELTETVTLFRPFKRGGKVELDEFFSDAEDDELSYEIIDSTLSKRSYSVDEDGEITIDSFPSKETRLTVRVTDAGGLSCEEVVTIYIRDMGIILYVVLGLLVIAVVVFVLVKRRERGNRAFGGTISVESCHDGVVTQASLSPMRGICKLSAFGLDTAGLNGDKTYFRATGGAAVELVSSVPVISNAQRTKTVTIRSGSQVKVSLRPNDTNFLRIKFVSSGSNAGPGVRPVSRPLNRVR